jgi:hypothetical protein
MATVIRLRRGARELLTTKSILPSVRIVTAAALMLIALPAACTTLSIPSSAHQAGAGEADLAAYREIKASLDKDDAVIDYDTLMGVYKAMVQSPRPIAQTDRLLWQLINEHNEDPRIDQMILILAARIMGSSRHSIPGAQKLFESILDQDERINYWVLSHVAEAVGDYAFGLPQGDQLADAIEAELSRIISEDQSGQEDFGRHFLPPPKSDFIRNYINGIVVQADRQSERSRYYALIRNHLTEEQIVSASKYLQTHGEPNSGERCPLLMQCMLRFLDRLPFR